MTENGKVVFGYLVASRRLRRVVRWVSLVLIAAAFFLSWRVLANANLDDDNARNMVFVLWLIPIVVLFATVWASIVAAFTKVAVDDVRTDYLNQDIGDHQVHLTDRELEIIRSIRAG